MTQIAFVMLCHKDPETVAATARALVASGDKLAIHCDAAAPPAVFAKLTAELADLDGVLLVQDRVRCGWGEWSLVAATLKGLRAAHTAFPEATHFYLISGDCAPIKSATQIHATLATQDRDWIETVDFFEGNWIKTGMKEDRLIYRHWFNERSQPKRFYAAWRLQQRLGLSRKIPQDLNIRIGSQWWCLRRGTVDQVLSFVEERRDVTRFFATTWIPDETFFQTLVPHLVPRDQIIGRSPTFLMFTDYGLPVVFYNDHHELLLAQDAFMARKISPEARDLRQRLTALYGDPSPEMPRLQDGRRLFAYLTTRGRMGLRSAPRFWEQAATIGRGRTLFLVACKKWHLAKRLLSRVEALTGVPAVGFAFNEADTPLPDLGGIERGLDKRTRHRRALIRMLYEYHEDPRLALCLDTSSFDLIEDFYADRCTTRLLEIQCDFSDAYLAGHAQRTGLADASLEAGPIEALLPILRRDFQAESDRIADADLPHMARLHPSAPAEVNAAALMQVFDLGQEDAMRLASAPDLFND